MDGPGFTSATMKIPRHIGERADLGGKITTPDVLIQAHSASLGITFYNGKMFPPEYRVMDSRLNMDRGIDPNALAIKSSGFA